jgi:hypothetical protein
MYAVNSPSSQMMSDILMPLGPSVTNVSLPGYHPSIGVQGQILRYCVMKSQLLTHSGIHRTLMLSVAERVLRREAVLRVLTLCACSSYSCTQAVWYSERWLYVQCNRILYSLVAVTYSQPLHMLLTCKQ